MNQITFRDDPTDDVIRALDPAVKSLDGAAQLRAAASLEQIIVTDQSAGIGAGRVGGVHRSRRRLLLVPAIAAAALAIAVAGPMLTHTEPPAFAWTNTPSPVDAHAAGQATAACRDALQRSIDQDADVPAEIRPVIDPAKVRLVVSERRGNYMFVALGQGQATYSCLSPVTAPDQVVASGGALPTRSTPSLHLSSEDAIANGYGTGTAIGLEYASMVGYAGQDVTGVTIRTGGQDIHTSVSNGYFAAWWPTTGPQASPTPAHGYTLTIALKSGTTRTDSHSRP